jgi:hypothetical protein
MMSRLAVLAAALALPAGLSACVSSNTQFTSAAQIRGLNNIALGPVLYSGCGNEHEYARTFSAADSNGKKVEGVICGGLLGPTVFAAPPGDKRLVRLDPSQSVALASGS